MKKGIRLKIDFLPVLGVLGLILVVLYFLLANSGADFNGKFHQNGSYDLFQQLYQKLGYQLKDGFSTLLSPHPDDMLIYFDFDGNPEEWRYLLKQWVGKGGTLLIAGVIADNDPVSGERLITSRIDSVYADPNYTEMKAKLARLIFHPGRRYLRHYRPDSGLAGGRNILYSERGPLMYIKYYGKGTIFVLSDSDLLKNEMLRNEKLAVFFNRILRPYFNHPIYLVSEGFIAEPKNTSVLALLFQNKLLFVTLQLMGIFILFIIWQGKRFGEPQLIDPFARRSLREHLRAVGQFYQKTDSLNIIREIDAAYFRFRIQKVARIKIKGQLLQEHIEKLVARIISYTPGLTREEIRDCFRAEGEMSVSGHQQLEQRRDIIINALKRVKSGKQNNN